MKNLKLSLNIHVLKSKLHNITYCKILLIHPGHIYRQRTNLIGLYLGEGLGGGLYSGGNHLNLQSDKLIFLSFFFSV